ncbi:MAG TPA: phosphoribosylglycinamide formyltransferase [Chthoniobacterales bacterium]
MKSPLFLGVLGSGKGSNFRAIMDRIRAGKLHAEVRLVISDVPDAGILGLARAFEVPALTLRPSRFRTKLDPEVEAEAVQALKQAAVEWVVLAGFMRLVKAPLLDAFPRRVINVHPSLLPKYPGLSAWKQALEAGEQATGCTVHYVDRGMDTGDIIAQREVPIRADDTPDALHARIQKAEHDLLPEVLAELAESPAR